MWRGLVSADRVRAVPSDTTSLFIAHRRSLVDYAATIVGSRTQAEDLVQDAWLRFDRADRQLVKEPLAYLYRIVRNLALDGHRTIVRNGRVMADTDFDDVSAVAGSTMPSPEFVALYKDELRILREALAELPIRTRVAFSLHRLGGYKLREIAEHLNISVTLAQTLVADGAEHCRRRLGWP
jgi:RNA polymerase sigma-70 factor (ECF subfamily)